MKQIINVLLNRIIRKNNSDVNEQKLNGGIFINSTVNQSIQKDEKEFINNNFDDKIKVIIDGEDFISRIIKLQISEESIVNQISLKLLKQAILECKETSCDWLEFICCTNSISDCSLDIDKKNKLLERFSNEEEVYVEMYDDIKNKEELNLRIEEYIEEQSKTSSEIFIITSDTFFISKLKELRKKGRKVYTVQFNDDLDIRIKNECFKTYNMEHKYRDIFIYSYPIYKIESITINQYKDLISNADDRINNQLRVSESGYVYISKKYIGAQNIEDVKFRWETFNPYNEYVGPKAANNLEYIESTYKELKYNWDNNLKGYIDYWRTM